MRYCLTLAVLLSACALSGPQMPTQSPFGTEVEWDSLTPTAALRSTLESAPTVYAGFRVLHHHACDNHNKGQGNPLVHCKARPIVGAPHRIGWTVNPSGPFDKQRPAYLLVWFDRAEPTDLTKFGYDGCALWGPLDSKRLHTIVPAYNSPLTQDDGHLELTWTPPAAWLGKQVFCQLVVWSPGSNDRNWLLSPALQLWVGNK